MKKISNLKLQKSDLETYSKLYDDPNDKKVESIVESVKERGHLIKNDLVILGNWKSVRIRPLINQNSDAFVSEVTAMALSTCSPKLAMKILLSLSGVGMPTASSILQWFHQEPFPILDFRALWSLGIKQPSTYSLDFWEKYVAITRELANSWNTDMRTLDKALWQFSATNQLQNEASPL